MKLSVVIGTCNQKNVLDKTLQSLFRQTLPAELYEVQLIDSSSTDGTDKMIEALKPPCRLDYLRVENQGKTAARNLGIKKAAGEIILLTDADMIAEPGLLEAHLQAHGKRPEAAFEGLTINPDGKPYIKAWLWPWKRLKWAYFLTGNLSIKKATITAAGLFDENFKGYGWEDIELGYRLAQMKVPLLYLPAAVNHHHHPVSREGLIERKYQMGRSAALFYRKHPDFTIKMFLGLNPLAMGIYRFIKKHRSLLEMIRRQAARSPFYNYLLEEYQYRLGLEDGLSSL
ncbi:MAG: glycosyltransferase family 2 protein [Candidatus Saganbacteria bacterium]|nr:glycosyltransferase family 2 protein [Candidatus Saganbacteria bacterium]